MRPGSLYRAALTLILTCACSSDPAEAPAGAGAAPNGGAASAGGDGGTGGPGETGRCEEGSFPGSVTESVAVGSVTALIVDEAGEPTSAGLVQVCGKDLCINARVGDDGKVGEDVQRDMDAPALKVGDGAAWAKVAFAIGAGDSELGTLATARLPDFADGASFAPGTSISSGGVTLELASAAQIEVDTLSYETEAEQTFRAAPLPSVTLERLDPDFVAGFGLAPVETRICPPVGLKLENTAKLAPGTVVELYLQGFDVLEGFAAYGGWELVSEGAVSEDGESLDFAEGPPILTTIAVKVKPR